MSSPRTFLIPSLVVATGLLAACGGDDDTAATASPDIPEEEVVTMEESRYVPGTIEVSAGTGVTFENTDPYAHTVTSADGSPLAFDSGELAQDDTFSQTFDEAGSYEYFCQIHPTMRGEVVVS